MAKKTSSIHIENSLWDYISDYQKEHGIDSRNTAIEWILIEHRMKFSNKSNIKDNVEIKSETKEHIKQVVEKRESDDILAQIENDMKD